MGADLNLAFDAHVLDVERILLRLGPSCEPTSSPADEVGGEQRYAFLQENCGFGAHLDAMQVEDLFAFLDAGFNDLPGVVMIELVGHLA